MREIEFRGIDPKGYWQYGTYYYGEIGHYINDFQVDESTVGQYIGLKDKNGVKIFDGDIAELFGWGKQSESDGFSNIIWDIDVIGWNFERSSYAEDRYDFKKAVSNCLIVGNIHEHNHLIQ